MSAPTEPPLLRCADQCGATLPDDGAAVLQAGWAWLETVRRWRCGACVRALVAASGLRGTQGGPSVDNLPPDSIGALRKATAHTITKPSVKP